jgi:hypothetical protein
MTCNKCGREMVLLSAEASRENSSSLYYCENIGCPDWKTVKADISPETSEFVIPKTTGGE